MMPPTVRVVYLSDPSDARGSAGSAAPRTGDAGTAVAPAGDAGMRPVLAQVPLPLLAAIGERLAASAAQMQQVQEQRAPGAAGRVQDELARLERFGLQLQELAQVVARAQQLRHESVDLGLALLQTVAEWSIEADRQGVELHGPACSEPVHANPAALKHLLDLLVEHALQQGRAVRLEIEAPASGPGVRVVATVSSEPASQSPTRETLAWLMLQWLVRALDLTLEREVVARGERVKLVLPRA